MATLVCRSAFISDAHPGLRDCKAGYLPDFLRRLTCAQLYRVVDIIELEALARLRQRICTAGTSSGPVTHAASGRPRRIARGGMPRPGLPARALSCGFSAAGNRHVA
jgi:hypothetical protein